MKRLGVLLALAIGFVVAMATPASADPPRPTVYRTTVVAIEPPVAGLGVRILGGDSFVELTVPHGVEVTVLGYRNEEFLRVSRDGLVEEDGASYTARTSRSRYGSNVATDAAGPADWRVVARDGSYAWHDHRAHWMGRQPPVGKHPGDLVLDGVIGLRVNGQAVAVRLETHLLANVPVWPSIVAFVVGVLAAVWLGVRRIELALLAAALIAAVVGTATRWGLPSEAKTPTTQWLLPGLALVLAAAAMVRRERLRQSATLMTLAVVSLIEWALFRRTVFVKPVLPTSLPPWFDRAATAVVCGLVIHVMVRLVRRVTEVFGPEVHATDVNTVGV